MALKNVKYQPGDVIITKNGALADILGHASIVIDSKTVVNTSGKPTHRVPISKFIKDSSSHWIKLYRPNDYYEGANAAIWVDKTYGDSETPYSLFGDINSTETTNCTKMILQAYHFGNGGKGITKNHGIIAPFSLIDVLEDEGFSMAYMGKIVD